MIEPIGGEVGRELARFGPSAALGPLVEAWPARVGAEIARNAWPARLARDGTLHVHTSSAAWAFELGQLELRVREQLGELAPRRLRFAVGPLPEPVAGAPEHAARAPVAPAADALARAAELAAGVEDESLRKVVAEAAAWSLANADSDRGSW